MPTVLVCADKNETLSYLHDSLSSLNGWNIIPLNVHSEDIRIYKNDFNRFEIHYFIYTINLTAKSLSDLEAIRKNNPFSCIIYYNAFLINQQFFRLVEIGVNCCIIGINREKNLKEHLVRLWSNHWKRVPENIYPNSKNLENLRAKKIIRYIENNPITEWTTDKLAEYLKISGSHFRAEFKSNFGLNFRQFKQRLLNHYESKLLQSENFKFSDIYKVLNYKYIANYSRSFKSRHGDCWRNLKDSV